MEPLPDAGKQEENQWKAIQAESHQLLDGMWDRVRQKMGLRPDGEFWSFTQREDLAEALGQEISSYLLEKSFQLDDQLQAHSQSQKAKCPCCGRLVSRHRDKDGNPRCETVCIETKVGAVPIEAPLFFCWKCRRTFSPSKDVYPPK